MKNTIRLNKKISGLISLLQINFDRCIMTPVKIRLYALTYRKIPKISPSKYKFSKLATLKTLR